MVDLSSFIGGLVILISYIVAHSNSELLGFSMFQTGRYSPLPYVVGNFYGKFFIDYFKRTGERRRGSPSLPPPFPVSFLALGSGRSGIPCPSDPTWLSKGAHY